MNTVSWICLNPAVLFKETKLLYSFLSPGVQMWIPNSRFLAVWYVHRNFVFRLWPTELCDRIFQPDGATRCTRSLKYKNLEVIYVHPCVCHPVVFETELLWENPLCSSMLIQKSRIKIQKSTNTRGRGGGKPGRVRSDRKVPGIRFPISFGARTDARKYGQYPGQQQSVSKGQWGVPTTEGRLNWPHDQGNRSRYSQLHTRNSPGLPWLA